MLGENAQSIDLMNKENASMRKKSQPEAENIPFIFIMVPKGSEVVLEEKLPFSANAHLYGGFSAPRETDVFSTLTSATLSEAQHGQR